MAGSGCWATLITRATWSSTIARPGFNQSTASLSIDLGAGQVTTGNPNLKPATANSFDVSIEKYLPDAGILAFGVFDKYSVSADLFAIAADKSSDVFNDTRTSMDFGSAYALH